MGPSAGFAARQVVANLLKNSTQKRSGRCIQHLATPQGAKNGSRESAVTPSKRLLADSKVEYELHHSSLLVGARDVAAVPSSYGVVVLVLLRYASPGGTASLMEFSAGGALFLTIFAAMRTNAIEEAPSAPRQRQRREAEDLAMRHRARDEPTLASSLRNPSAGL